MTADPSTEWVLGIDIGTGSCKCVAVSPAAEVLGFGSSEYRRGLLEATVQEQDLEWIWEAVQQAARQAVERAGLRPEACAGISLGGAMHGLAALDEAGRPLTGLITWADGRAARQVEAAGTVADLPGLYRLTGCPAHWLYPLYKILWLRDEQPDVFRRAAWFASAKEVVLERLTGTRVIDPATAAGMALLNTHTQTWEPAALELAGIRAEQLSPLAGPQETIGRLLPEGARALGLPAGTPVVLGSADSANSSLGAGGALPGQATCMIGTSGALRVFSPQPVIDPSGRAWCYAVDRSHWLVGGAINNGGLALAWLRDLFNQAVPGCPVDQRLTFAELVDRAEEVGPGASGVLCLPFFAGERSPRWNLHARAVFFGLSVEHGPGHMARALLEGVAFRLRAVQGMLAEAGVEARQLRASGGFVRSDAWVQIVASVLGRDLTVPVWSDTSSLGAALWALAGTGGFSDLAEWSARVPVRGVFRPNAEDAALYDRMEGLHRRLYDALEGAFVEVAGLQADLRG